MNTHPPSPASPAPPLHKVGSGRPWGAEVVEAVRRLVEGTRLPVREIAARVGVSRGSVARLRGRHGWSRPRPIRVRLEGQRGGGHPIVPEVVAEARALLEGTRLSFKAVAERTGVSATTLCRWCKRGRWVRPGASEGPARPFRNRRGRGRPYAGDAVGRARDLLTGTLLSQKAIARQVGISQAQISVWLRRRGWTRPAVPARPAQFAPWTGPSLGRAAVTASARFAASRRGGLLASDGDRRGRPYARSVRAEARVLWEETRLSTGMIGARLGVHPVTVSRWAREAGWWQPRGRTSARKLRGFFGAMKRRAG